jgi:hypothetical protein
MSGAEVQKPESAAGLVERREARRYLLRLSGMYLGAALIGLAGLRPLRWLGAVMLITCAVLVILSRAQRAADPLSPRVIRDIAHVAEVPVRGAAIVVYASLIAGLTGGVTLAIPVRGCIPAGTDTAG